MEIKIHKLEKIGFLDFDYYDIVFEKDDDLFKFHLTYGVKNKKDALSRIKSHYDNIHLGGNGDNPILYNYYGKDEFYMRWERNKKIESLWK